MSKFDLKALPGREGRSEDTVKRICQVAVANLERMEDIADALESQLAGLPASELSRMARTVIVARSNVVKLATNAVKDLVGPLRGKNIARDV